MYETKVFFFLSSPSPLLLVPTLITDYLVCPSVQLHKPSAWEHSLTFCPFSLTFHIRSFTKSHLIHSFCLSEMQPQLNGVFCFKFFHRVHAGWCCSHHRAWLGGACFQAFCELCFHFKWLLAHLRAWMDVDQRRVEGRVWERQKRERSTKWELRCFGSRPCVT